MKLLSLATLAVLILPTGSFQCNHHASFIPNRFHHSSAVRTRKTLLELVPIDITTSKVVEINAVQRTIDNSLISSSNMMEKSINNWIQSSSSSLTIASSIQPPTQDEIKLLNEALSSFYNEKDYKKAETLLTKTIHAWQRQSSDEKAALYRIRGDCYMELDDMINEAIQDYSESITLLQTPESLKLADPNELPTSYLGRGRAIRSLPKTEQTMSKLLQIAINDYEQYLILTARDSQYMDNDDERLEDGILRNPYAAWEYAATLRTNKDYDKAAFIREQASAAFDYIGDTAHSVITYLDYGIDLAMSYSTSANSKVSLDKVTDVLSKGIETTTKVEGRDITLLQHVVSKEGEGRLALASILWNEKNIPVDKAENVLGDACIRLEQLEQDNNDRLKKIKTKQQPPPLGSNKVFKFSIDGSNSVLDAGEISCSKFKNEKFVSNVLGWPDELKEKVKKLETLKR